MEAKPTVAILMSTYNGEKYLREQLDSIFAQEDVNVKLIVRDDGSSDRTLDILKEYNDIKLIKGENIGCESSFLLLLREKISADYYAFADQDDIWFPNKLSYSIQAINKENTNKPCLFCANQIITDKDLNYIQLMIGNSISGIDAYKYRDINYFSNRHGCSMVWNKPLEDISQEISSKISFVPFHDVWLNLVAKCVGNVMIGYEPLQYYRIHSSNTGGLAIGTLSRFKKGVKRYWFKNFNRDLYAKACMKYLNMYINENEGWKYIKRVSEYKENVFTRFRVAFSKQIWFRKRIDNAFFAISVLLGKY